MSEGAWTVIGVVIGAVIRDAGKYVVRWQKRRWEIGDERRKVRQERLKRARQQVEEMASWAGKCFYGDTPWSEIPWDVIGNFIVTIKYVSEKHGHALSEERVRKAKQLTKRSVGEKEGAGALEICGEVLMWIDEAMEATFE